MFTARFLLLASVCAALALPAHAETATAPVPETPVPQVRHDQLAKVQEMLSDPDPLMRQANMEAIVKAGDASQIRIAQKIAFVSDDKDLRAIAMRAYLASMKELVFDIAMPDPIQKAYDAVKSNPEELSTFVNKQGYRFVGALQAWHMVYGISIDNYDFTSNGGKFQQTTNREKRGTFTIVGDVVKGQGEYSLGGYGYQCQFAFKPTRDLTLTGTMACNFGENAPPVTISAPMF